jgi:hypothetical protein
MKFTVTKWTIKKLVDYYSKGKLNLSPPYQRNFIWSTSDQQYLIESVLKNNPIPNFFILKNDNGQMEMVDGQQRSRTILSFINKQFKDTKGLIFSKDTHGSMLNFEFPITIITDIEGESIEKFYALVNKTGIHLNKPEVRKADYYNTNLLNLINEIATSKNFKELKIFTENSLKRMNDVEFISELVVVIKKGNVDKKGQLDEYFKNDLRIEECSEIKLRFYNALDKINILNQVYNINKTRYKQRNDFYTLFNFVINNKEVSLEALIYFYKILVLIGSDIKPTQENCEPLKEYARNCVTQSNSKSARESRLKFFNDLLLNRTNKLNKVQSQILSFYNLNEKENELMLDGHLVFKIDKLLQIKNINFQ